MTWNVWNAKFEVVMVCDTLADARYWSQAFGGEAQGYWISQN